MEIKYNDKDLLDNIGTSIWICCLNKNRVTFPQKVYLNDKYHVRLYDKNGGVSKKEIAICGIGCWGNWLEMFTDKQECIDRWTHSVNSHIKSLEFNIIAIEGEITKFEDLLTKAQLL